MTPLSRFSIVSFPSLSRPCVCSFFLLAPSVNLRLNNRHLFDRSRSMPCAYRESISLRPPHFTWWSVVKSVDAYTRPCAHVRVCLWKTHSTTFDGGFGLLKGPRPYYRVVTRPMSKKRGFLRTVSAGRLFTDEEMRRRTEKVTNDALITLAN